MGGSLHATGLCLGRTVPGNVLPRGSWFLAAGFDAVVGVGGWRGGTVAGTRLAVVAGYGVDGSAESVLLLIWSTPAASQKVAGVDVLGSPRCVVVVVVGMAPPVGGPTAALAVLGVPAPGGGGSPAVVHRWGSPVGGS